MSPQIFLVTMVFFFCVPFSLAEGACAYRIPTTEKKAEDAKAFCATNQDVGKATDAAINLCGGNGNGGVDRNHKCFVADIWVQMSGKWVLPGESYHFPNSMCGAVAVAPLEDASIEPPIIRFYASSGHTASEAKANAIAACGYNKPSLTCEVIAAQACDTLPTPRPSSR
jgi:hypothetical protein